jgi:hypothetical protein
VIPLWIKILYTVLTFLVVVAYARNYGFGNFLWFSDIAMIVTAIALWTENRLLASIMAVGVLLPELVWNVAYFGRLVTGHEFGGITGYMFDATKPLYLRNLSLFHVILPPLLLYMVWRLGYDSRGWLAMTVLAWVVLPVSYVVSKHSDNINWVFGIGKPQTLVHPLLYLFGLMLVFPLLVFTPTHFLLRAFFRVPAEVIR